MNTHEQGTEELHEEFEPDESGAEDLATRGDELDPQTLLRERDDAITKWQRARADYQNLKRRGLSDYENGLRRSLQPLAESLLLVLDNLDLALAAPVTSEDAVNLAMGVQLTRDQLVSSIATLEVKPIPVEGEFDPAVHQAVETVEDSAAAPGSIVGVVRPGFTWRHGVLRHAQVRVAAAPGGSSEGAEGGADGGGRAEGDSSLESGV